MRRVHSRGAAGELTSWQRKRHTSSLHKRRTFSRHRHRTSWLRTRHISWPHKRRTSWHWSPRNRRRRDSPRWRIRSAAAVTKAEASVRASWFDRDIMVFISWVRLKKATPWGSFRCQ
jgi:hypothetical protein